MNQREMTSVIMEAEADFQDIMRTLETDFTSPTMEDVRGMWAMIPPAVKEILKAQDPEQYKKMTALIEGGQHA